MATDNVDSLRRSRTLFNYSLGGSVALALLGVVLAVVLQVLGPASTGGLVAVIFGLALALVTLALATYLYRVATVLRE